MGRGRRGIRNDEYKARLCYFVSVITAPFRPASFEINEDPFIAHAPL